MVNFTSHISLLLLLFLCAITFQTSTSSNSVRCNEKDSKILLIFKQGIIDDFNRLSTWSSEDDCCAWEGVLCDNTTARVTELQLSQSFLDDEEFINQFKPLKELCGAPLPKCTPEENTENVTQTIRNEEGDPERELLYLGMSVGFAVGFWGSCGSLFFNKRWRHTFFHFLFQVADLISVTWMVKLNRFRKSQTSTN